MPRARRVCLDHVVFDRLQQRGAIAQRPSASYSSRQVAGEAQAVAKHDRASFYARHLADVRDHCFGVEFVVRIERVCNSGGRPSAAAGFGGDCAAALGCSAPVMTGSDAAGAGLDSVQRTAAGCDCCDRSRSGRRSWSGDRRFRDRRPATLKRFASSSRLRRERRREIRALLLLDPGRRASATTRSADSSALPAAAATTVAALHSR